MKLGTTIRHPPSNCTNCGRPNDGATPVADCPDAMRPNPGDTAVCYGCGHVMVYGDDLSLREPNDADIVRIAGDPRLIAAQKAMAQAKAARAEMDKLLEAASGFVEKRFRQTGQIAPLWHGVTAAGDNVITAALDSDKDTNAILLKALFKLRGVTHVIGFDEAWMLARDTGISKTELTQVQREGVRSHPDRIEVVMFICEHINHPSSILAYRRIERPAQGRAKLGPLVAELDSLLASGRLVGLLR